MNAFPCCPILLVVLFFVSTALPGFAGVTVIQNVAPGATSWPGTPIISTLSNPSGSATVAESFNGGGGCTNYGQTFTVTGGNFTLQTISIYAGGGSGTSGGTNLVLRLFDLGTQTAPNPSPYTASILGDNLFGSGAGLSVTYANQTNGILQFDFTGADQITLTNGHMYVFELAGAINTSPVSWFRTISGTYSGGAAYRNQSWINGNNAREFAMALYAPVFFETNYPPVPYGIVQHIFTRPINGGVNQDGANPEAGLVVADGVLCGTTVNGGLQGAGTAFYLKPDASGFTVMRSFASQPDASNPQGDLAVAGSKFFGSSFSGGASGTGALFAGQTNGSVSIIRNFPTVHSHTATNSGGACPGSLLSLSGGTVFGTASAGGASANGIVFSMTTNGSAFTVLHHFTLLNSGTGTNTDGAVPWGGLVLFGNTLYGTASGGGDGGNGVVFSLNTNGSNFTVLYSFSPMDVLTATNTDGAIPLSGLVFSGGTLYGTTSAGGQGGCGTLFSIGTNGLSFTVLHHFSVIDPVTRTNTDGASPCAPLMLSGNVLYGTAPAGGTNSNGTVYSVRTDGAQFATLYSFGAMDSSTGTNNDGALPVAGLVRVGNALYGTTFSGGPGSVGTVFGLPISIPPAVISDIVRNANGSLTLFFLGGPDSLNVIQVATNLASPVTWQNVSTNVADAGGVWQFTESNATNGARFYRSYAP